MVEGEIHLVPVSHLRLDPSNFRFPERKEQLSQEDLIIVLDRDYDLIPIGKSLAKNGFFSHEPLVAVTEQPADEMWAASPLTVVEGNRRLAAIRLLTDDGIRSKVRHSQQWTSLSRKLSQDLGTIPVAIYTSRKLVMAYLAQRHIAGVQKWSPLAKARFIAEMADLEGDSVDLGAIADQTASSIKTIHELYSTLMAVKEAREIFGLDTRLIRDNFTYLQRALNYYSEIAEYVGFERPRVRREPEPLGVPSHKPIPIERREQFAELLGFLYGSLEPAIDPVVRDSRDISKLAKVLGSADARSKLNETRDLDVSFSYLKGAKVHVVTSINEVIDALQTLEVDIRQMRAEPAIEDALTRLKATVERLRSTSVFSP